MKLCASHRCDAKHRAKLDEIRYSLLTLPSALDGSVEASILKILEINSFSDNHSLNLEKLKNLIEENNLIIDCYKLEDYVFLARNLPPQKVMYHFPITTYNDLYYVLYFHPYAIMLGEPLTFSLPKVRKTIEYYTPADLTMPQIRVHPAIGRPNDWNFILDDDNGLRHFWITPQTLPVYEPYVDVLDLYDTDVRREQALVDVYSQEQYMLPISTLVKHCESSLPCGFISAEFANRRLECGQSCMTSPYACHYCSHFERLSSITEPSYSNE